MQINSANYIVSGSSFFFKYPNIENCHQGNRMIDKDSTEFDEICVPKYFCKNPDITYDINWKMHNFIHDFDFLC